SEGARVAVANRRVETGEAAVAAIRDAGGDALFVQTDVSKGDDVERLMNAVLDQFGRIDVLVNNAGILGDLTATADSSEENWDRVFDVNLKGRGSA
ncbi:MAG: SDR family NAD(P)-dependent oxidoreductase, partial [Myxococcales bacterium]|nr:SDR family NAD(P)-dependent oxidoreductase [Myxococcales bacterium]